MIKIVIDEKLKEKEKSMYWLSEITGISYPTIFNLTNNKTSSIRFEILEKIYKALDCKSFDEILEYLPEKDKQ